MLNPPLEQSLGEVSEVSQGGADSDLTMLVAQCESLCAVANLFAVDFLKAKCVAACLKTIT
jgi:hypothetical protein